MPASTYASPTAVQVGLEDAIHTALLTLKEGFEGAVSSSNIEVAIVGADRKFRVCTLQ
jgi:20S proteasome subunit alpha 2